MTLTDYLSKQEKLLRKPGKKQVGMLSTKSLCLVVILAERNTVLYADADLFNLWVLRFIVFVY